MGLNNGNLSAQDSSGLPTQHSIAILCTAEVLFRGQYQVADTVLWVASWFLQWQAQSETQSIAIAGINCLSC